MTVLKICVGSSCHLKGSFEVVQQLKQLVEDHHLNDQVEMQASFCMKNCQRGVCVAVDDEIFSVSPYTVSEFFRQDFLPRVQKQKA